MAFWLARVLIIPTRAAPAGESASRRSPFPVGKGKSPVRIFLRQGRLPSAYIPQRLGYTDSRCA
jgi:hypothetical protein